MEKMYSYTFTRVTANINELIEIKNMSGNLGKEHKVFKQLDEYIDFYDSLSFHIMNWGAQGTSAIINPDTYVFSSIQGTLESIRDILTKGRHYGGQ